jgi:hypothetical protein
MGASLVRPQVIQLVPLFTNQAMLALASHIKRWFALPQCTD